MTYREDSIFPCDHAFPNSRLANEQIRYGLVLENLYLSLPSGRILRPKLHISISFMHIRRGPLTQLVIPAFAT